MTWKGCEKEQSRSDFKVLSQHLPGGTKENHEIHVRIAWSQARGLNPVPLKYEGVVSTRLWPSVGGF
jgi:hypothetical protein